MPRRQRGRAPVRPDRPQETPRVRPPLALRARRRRAVRRAPRGAAPRRRGDDARGCRPRHARGADGRRRAGQHPVARDARPAHGAHRGRHRQGAAAAGGREPARRGDDRARLPRHDHAACDPSQRARGPQLVHRLHAVPARDQPGPARGAAQLPDRGGRPDGSSHRRRLAARRGHRRGRGHDAREAGEQESHRPVRRGRRCPAADHRRGAHPRPGDGHRGGGGRPHRGAARARRGADAVRRAGAVPGHLRPGGRPAPGDRGGPRARRARRRRRRPARAHPARVTRRTGRRRRRRVVAAVRRPAVLRRPARGVHVGVVRAGTAPPGPAGRSERGRRGAAGVPAGAADPRAAHPSRQGDVEHLYRAGAARRRGGDVRRLPRSRRATGDRDPHPPLRRGARRRAQGRRARGDARGVLRHRGRAGARPGRGRRHQRPPARGPPAARRRRHRGRLHLRGDHPLDAHQRAQGVRRHRRPRQRRPGHRRRPARVAASHDGLPHPRGVLRPPQRDRDAALPAAALGARLRARPRHDPARLLHDEAQRHRRDGAGVAAQASPTCTRSRRPRTPSATASSSSSSRAGWRRSPATTRCRSSRTPARRASWPG